MDETGGQVVVIENASTKGVGALENVNGSENVHHATRIMGGGEERIEAFLVKHTNGQAEEGTDDLVPKTISTYTEFAYRHITLELSGIKQQRHRIRRRK